MMGMGVVVSFLISRARPGVERRSIARVVHALRVRVDRIYPNGFVSVTGWEYRVKNCAVNDAWSWWARAGSLGR